MNRSRLASAALLFASLVLAGCSKSKDQAAANAQPSIPVVQPASDPTKADEVAVERAKLSPADRALVEAQEWCVISTDERLGSMGPPLKLDIKGQPVFVCCKGCKKKAEADPDKTLATVAELKAKKAGGKSVAPEKKADPKDDKHDHGKTDPKGGHDHGAGGMGMGGMGMGMMGDPKAMQDMMGIRSLFAARDKITRKVTNLKDGVETITESEDAKIAEQIRQHVATMYKRIEDGKPIMPMNHQPIFGELIKHAKSIRFKSEKTEKGIKVIETSDDSYVAKLLQSHAELVTAFIKNGMEQMMKEYPLPPKDAAPGVGATTHTKDSTETVKKAITDGKAILLDVREKSEWDDGHLKDARLLPLSTLPTAAPEDIAKIALKDKTVYVHCGSGVRCLKAADVLQKLGYDVRPLKLGYSDLLKAGFDQAK